MNKSDVRLLKSYSVLEYFFTKYFFSLTEVIIWMTTFFFYISNLVLKQGYSNTNLKEPKRFFSMTQRSMY